MKVFQDPTITVESISIEDIVTTSTCPDFSCGTVTPDDEL